MKRWIKLPNENLQTKTELETCDKTKPNTYYIKNNVLWSNDSRGKPFKVAKEFYQEYDQIADYLEEMLESES